MRAATPDQHPPNAPPKFVISSKNRWCERESSAFSLVELVAVIAVMVILLAFGVGLLSRAGSHARKAAVDQISGMIEQARTTAITSRCYVVLAVVEPAEVAAGDGRCRLGLFKVQSWPAPLTGTVKGVLMSRWMSLESGIALIDGAVDGGENPMDGHALTIDYGIADSQSVSVHAIAFNSRGGLHYPLGSTPVALRIAECVYRDGRAIPTRHGESAAITESRLKIGRVTSHSYQIDG